MQIGLFVRGRECAPIQQASAPEIRFYANKTNWCDLPHTERAFQISRKGETCPDSGWWHVTALAALGNRFYILRSSAASKAQLETSPQ